MLVYFSNIPPGYINVGLGNNLFRVEKILSFFMQPVSKYDMRRGFEKSALCLCLYSLNSYAVLFCIIVFQI